MNKNERLSKDNPEFQVNLIDLLRILDPSESGKFMTFLIKQFKEVVLNENNKLMGTEVTDMLDKLSPDLSPIEKYQLSILLLYIGKENLYALWEFNKHLDENRIEEKDIQKYASWSNIANAVMDAEIKQNEKELRKQIDVIYDDHDWVVLKPLSFESSLAYGAGTKWCTASKHNPNYFYDYTNRGMLIYVMNRKTQYKFAMYVELKSNEKSFQPKQKISFWSASDIQTESMELNIPDFITDVLRKQITDKTQLKPNKYFFDKKELNNLKSMDDRKSSAPLAQALPQRYQHEINLMEVDEDAAIGHHVFDAVDLDDEGDIEETEEVLMDRPARALAADIDRDIIGGMLDQAPVFDEATIDQMMNDDSEDEMENGEPADNGVRPVTEITIKYSDDKCILGPGIEPIDGTENFYPAPWLTKQEIREVLNTRVKGFLCDKDQMTYVYYYPNGRIIRVLDTISNGVVIRRDIREARVGRNENEKINPFGNNGNVDLNYIVEREHELNNHPRGERPAHAIEDMDEIREVPYPPIENVRRGEVMGERDNGIAMGMGY